MNIDCNVHEHDNFKVIKFKNLNFDPITELFIDILFQRKKELISSHIKKNTYILYISTYLFCLEFNSVCHLADRAESKLCCKDG